jgi:hypothetical protein
MFIVFEAQHTELDWIFILSSTSVTSDRIRRDKKSLSGTASSHLKPSMRKNNLVSMRHEAHLLESSIAHKLAIAPAKVVTKTVLSPQSTFPFWYESRDWFAKFVFVLLSNQGGC